MQLSEAASLALDGWARNRAHVGQSVGEQLPLLAGEVGNEIRAGAVVLADIVVVDGLLEETAVGDRCVNGRGGGGGEAEEWLSVDLAHKLAVDFDARVGRYHLQVEHEP